MPERSGVSARVITDIDDLPGLESEWRGLHEQNARLSFFSSYDFIRNTCRFLLRPEQRIFVVTLRTGGRLAAVVPLYFSRKKKSGLNYVAVELIGCREGDRPGISSIMDARDVWKELQILLDREEGYWQVLHLSEMDPSSVRRNMLPWIHSSRYSCFLETDRVSYSVGLRGTFAEYLSSRPPTVQRLYRRHLSATQRKLGAPELLVYSGEAAGDEGLSRYCEIEKKSRKFAQGITLVTKPRRVEFYRVLCADLAAEKSAHVFVWTAGGKDLAGSLVFTHGRQVYEREIAFNQEYQSLSPGIMLQTAMFKHYFGRGFDEFDLLGMHPSHGEPQHKADWATVKRDTVRFSAVVNRSRLFPWICFQKLMRRENVYSDKQDEAA